MSSDLETRLRSTFDNLAREASPIRVEQTTWTRGRRARVRDRAAGLAAVVVMLVCLGSIGLLARTAGGGEASPATDPSGDGVPSMIWDVPVRLSHSTADTPGTPHIWDKRVAETDLAIGRGAVAFATGEYGGNLPVVVTASDGRYHPLELPGYLAAAMVNTGYLPYRSTPLALSADGTRLAYGWWDPAAPLDKPMPAGIRIVELLDGSIKTIPLFGGNGIQVNALSWSPDGRWLGWGATRTKSWTPTNIGTAAGPDGGGPIFGRLTPSLQVETCTCTLGDNSKVAITSDGLVIANDGNWPRIWNGISVDRQPRREADSFATPAVWSPSGDLLAWTSAMEASGFDVEADGTFYTQALPGGGKATVRALGWIDEKHLVVSLDRSPEGDKPGPDSELVIATINPGQRATYKVVGKIRADVNTDLTIAVDLMSTDRPTVDRPEPDWPWSSERKFWTFALAAIAAVLAARLARRWWRERRLLAP